MICLIEVSTGTLISAGNGPKAEQVFRIEESFLFPDWYVPRVLKRKLVLELECDLVRDLMPVGSNVN